jgi:hypothetical protein
VYVAMNEDGDNTWMIHIFKSSLLSALKEELEMLRKSEACSRHNVAHAGDRLNVASEQCRAGLEEQRKMY